MATPDMPNPDPTTVAVTDQAGSRWHLSDHLDTGALLVFLRGDW